MKDKAQLPLEVNFNSYKNELYPNFYDMVTANSRQASILKAKNVYYICV